MALAPSTHVCLNRISPSTSHIFCFFVHCKGEHRPRGPGCYCHNAPPQYGGAAGAPCALICCTVHITSHLLIWCACCTTGQQGAEPLRPESLDALVCVFALIWTQVPFLHFCHTSGIPPTGIGAICTHISACCSMTPPYKHSGASGVICFFANIGM